MRYVRRTESYFESFSNVIRRISAEREENSCLPFFPLFWVRATAIALQIFNRSKSTIETITKAKNTLTITRPERHYNDAAMVSLLLTLKIFHTVFCF